MGADFFHLHHSWLKNQSMNLQIHIQEFFLVLIKKKKFVWSIMSSFSIEKDMVSIS
jgi:hypothetical protein